jgi:hypothetical protein
MARAHSAARVVPICAYLGSVRTDRNSQEMLVDAARNLVPGEIVWAAFTSRSRDAGKVEMVLHREGRL